MKDPRSSAIIRRPGLDVLRVLAAVLVFAQHLLSCAHYDSWIDVAGFRMGRIGTAIFFLLAGFLAASSSRSALVWFRDRLNMLLPPFWLMTIAGFLLALISGEKSFDGWQVICQMSGAGYFTHGEKLINVATWFMSPLLLLYVVVLCGRLTSPKTMATAAIGACGAVIVHARGDMITVECHAITFLIAFLAGQSAAGHQPRLALVTAVLMGGLTLVYPEFRYGSVAFALLSVALCQRRTVVAAQRFARVAYEWFLVHGLCISLVAHATTRLRILAPVSAVLSLLAAILLKKSVHWLQARLPAGLTPEGVYIRPDTGTLSSVSGGH